MFFIGARAIKIIITVYKLFFLLFIYFCAFIASPKLDFKPGYPKRIYKHTCGARANLCGRAPGKKNKREKIKVV